MKSQFQNWSQSEPVDGRTLTKRWPADDRRIHCRPPAIDRSPSGHRWVSWWSSAGNRWGIGRKFGHSRGNRPVAEQSPVGGRQAPAGWLYDMVEGQVNRPMSCRSRKIGIRQKSTGHRVIYVFWDVGFTQVNCSSCESMYSPTSSHVSAPS